MEKLPKIKSITKKLVVALLGAFLIVFLTFHMCANLFILADDGGDAYSAFCHFMGTNFLIKIMEVFLMASVLLHILITVMLWFQNFKARGTVRYHVASKTKTAVGSKITIWTGVLILCFLVLHFINFYFVKMDIVKGNSYMAKTEEVINAEVKSMLSATQYGMTPDQILETYGQQMEPAQLAKMEKAVPVANLVLTLDDNSFSKDGKWIKGLNYDQKEILVAAEIEAEPDFYQTARNLFGNKIYSLVYLLCFVVLWFHLRHAFEAAFQTLGLTNYTYHRIIEVIGIIIAWVICLGFAAVPIAIMFF